MIDIEDIGNQFLENKICYLTNIDCCYFIGINCFHPIYTYLLSKLNINQINKIKIDTYHIDKFYTKYKINQIINLIYKYDIFNHELLNFSIFYFEYFINKTNIFLDNKNIFIIWFLSVLICSKFIFDQPYSNYTYSLLFELDIKTINYLEIQYIRDIQFKLFHQNIKHLVKKIYNEIKLYHIQKICNISSPKLKKIYHKNLIY